MSNEELTNNEELINNIFTDNHFNKCHVFKYNIGTLYYYDFIVCSLANAKIKNTYNILNILFNIIKRRRREKINKYVYLYDTPDDITIGFKDNIEGREWYK